MNESIKEIPALELAEKIESGAELQTVERIAAGAIIRDYDRQKQARKTGGKIGGAAKGKPNDGRGGGRKITNDSEKAEYMREAKRKSRAKLKKSGIERNKD